MNMLTQASPKLHRAQPIRTEAPNVAMANAAPRLVIAGVTPAVDAGRHPVKRLVGEQVTVEADVVCDGHATLVVMLLWRAADNATWSKARMLPLGNDRWRGSFPLQRLGRYVYTVEAWVDVFASFRQGLAKLHAAGMPIDLDVREGCDLVADLARRNPTREATALAARLHAAGPGRRLQLLLADTTARVMQQIDPMAFHLRLEPVLPVDAERKAAQFASWYELFPRSQSSVPGRHGTFDDTIARLPAIRRMGFDVLYFPPIHPIGQSSRKGPNNALTAGPDDPGSPYAIGSAEGGHDAIHPELGTLESFRRLVKAARAHDMELALDFAIQCSPDHPWLREHPEWFEKRADGSIRHAENPPKKYQDIVNVSFYNEGAMPSLWYALRDVVLFWVHEGVRLFRVDNPHTKPLPFWEWMIGDIRAEYPDVVFLAEAFTRPKVMYQLAKVGFSQSYTYFTWRNTAREMRDYLTELTTTAPADFFRPHFFVNTPDINPTFLHHSGRPGFLIRAALATTLSGLWGMYNGFELLDSASLDGHEEYLDSEKYQLRHWNHDSPDNIVAEITKLNDIRAGNPALHTHLGVRFLECSNDQLLCYVKATPNRENILLIIVSFDPAAPQEGEVVLDADTFGDAGNSAIAARDLLHGGSAEWPTGPRTFQFDPGVMPFGIWQITKGTGA